MIMYNMYKLGMMMMIIAHNSLVRQKKGAQRELEKEAGGRRKGGPTRIPTPGEDALTGPTRSGVLDARKRRMHGQQCGVPLHKKGRGG